MRSIDSGVRTFGIALDRVVGCSNERMAWPAISFNDQRYLSALHKADVPKCRQSLLAVTLYLVGRYNNVNRKTYTDAGVDVFWKPNGQFQVSAILNSDFAQAESDGIVVNFSAIETFFGDKRSFSTRTKAISRCRSPLWAAPSS